ncbi:hypothetical protein [Gryllotalpicola koreensis]|uniref:MFS transporter n=1 Tax=Gryllotalpicola koreensis TaxID=993086 RepID=A0ABP8ACH6_9MICO
MQSDSAASGLAGPAMSRAARAATAIPSLAFTLVVAGQNVPNALLPEYDRRLGLGAVGLAIVFSIYLAALVVTLIVMSRPVLQRRPVLNLVIAAFVAICGDGALLVGSLPALLAGRALMGVAVGLGTGSAAAAAVTLIGERGRTVTATGNVVGAVVGTLLGAVAAELSGGLTLGYVIHAAATAVMLILLATAGVRALARARDAGPAAGAPQASLEPHPPGSSLRLALGFLAGLSAWGTASLVIAFVPSAITHNLGSASLLLASVGTLVLLVAASIGQFALMFTRSRWTVWAAIALTAVGLPMLTIGILAGALPLVLIGCAALGGAQGGGYRIGLRLVSVGLDPASQGARASAYACVSYGGSVVIVVVASFIGGGGGEVAALVTSAGILAMLISATAVTALIGTRAVLPGDRRRSERMDA